MYILSLNLCKLLFTFMTVFVVFFGALINFWEPYLPVIVKKTFRYGKLASKEEFAYVKKVEVPKSFFRHFYVTSAFIYCPVAVHEIISVYIFGHESSNWLRKLLDLFSGYNRVCTTSATHTLIAVFLMMLQIYRRFYDTHFVSIFSKNASMNFCHYVAGMVHYPAVILVLLSEAPNFTSNYDLELDFRDIRIIDIFAIMIFFWAWYHQHVATVILAELRKNGKGQVVSQDYKIPHNDWFKYLSSPHSTAEIIMYSALTILLWNNTNWWFVYAWVLTNQVEMILLSHWWYKSHFKNFPVDRKALIPFIF